MPGAPGWPEQRRRRVLAQQESGGHSPAPLWQRCHQAPCYWCAPAIRRFQLLQQSEKESSAPTEKFHHTHHGPGPRDNKNHDEHLKRPSQTQSQTHKIHLPAPPAAAGQLWNSTFNSSAWRNEEVQVENRKLWKECREGRPWALSGSNSLEKPKNSCPGHGCFGCSSASSLIGSYAINRNLPMTTRCSCIRQNHPDQSSKAVSSTALLFFQINGSSLERDKNSNLYIYVCMCVLKHIYYVLGSTKLFEKINFQI